MNDVRDKWWVTVVAVLLVCALIAAFIPGYRPGAFVLGVAALLVYAWGARQRAQRGKGT